MMFEDVNEALPRLKIRKVPRHSGRGGQVTPASQRFEYLARVHLGDPRTANDMGLLSRLHHEEQRVQAAIRLHLVGQRRKVGDEMGRGNGGDNDLHAVNVVPFRRSRELGQHTDLLGSKIARDEIGNDVQVRPLADEIGCGQSVPLGGRMEGKRAGLLIDAESEDRGLEGRYSYVPFPKEFDHERRRGADLLDHFDLSAYVAFRWGMMVIEVDRDAGTAKSAFELSQAAGIAVINDDQPGDLLHIDVPESFGLDGVSGRFDKEVPHALFLGAGEDQLGAGVKLLRRHHGGQGVEIGIRMTGNDLHSSNSECGVRSAE